MKRIIEGNYPELTVRMFGEFQMTNQDGVLNAEVV